MRLDPEEIPARHRIMAEFCPVGILEAELPGGRVLYSNPAFRRMLGLAPEERLGLKLVEFFEEPQAEELNRKILPATFEGKIQTAAGDIVTTLTDCRSLSEADGSRRVVFYFQDLTKIKQMERELWQSQKMEAIGTLAAGIAHDFNNLLTVIMGSVSLMRASLGADHCLQELVAKMEQAAKSGAEITRKLIGYAGQGKYHITRVDLNQLVGECCELIGRSRSNILIVQELAPDLWPIAADKGQIELVLANLFVNAVEAMPAGGRLSIRTRNCPEPEPTRRTGRDAATGGIALEVSDSGVGMDAATLKHIFDPFFTTKAMGRGVGLGLAAVYGIVNNHGGAIEAASAKGSGTTFTLFFPAARPGSSDRRGYEPRR
ncbi:MAG: ATP-binding protein [Desulfobacterales bacterium]|nr:ATP-binding protein [Desulfobacterales bacterium]